MSTNEITDDELEYFEFESEFQDVLEMFTIPYDGEGDGIRAIFSFNPPVEDSEHIIEKEGIGKVVNTDGGVLLGKMSFQMTADVFDVGWFSLEESDDSSPLTGIKINIDGTQYYEEQSTFRFTDKTASKDSSLSNLVLSSGVVDEDDPDKSTYKEYGLTPTFDKDTLNYELELLEYIDKMNITATTTDSKSTMKIKVPKRNDDNELVYDSDGSTIIYEEKDIESGVPLEITLNKLGEPDTKITIIVTAEDGKTVSNYEVVIKRPYGTIKGKSILADFDDPDVVENFLDIYGINLSNKTTINVYESDLVEWESIPDIYGMVYDDPFTYEKLESIENETSEKSDDDGTFEIYVIPGKYDIQVTRLAYLDYIYSDVEVNAGDIIDMGEFRMAAGDANRDGVISQEDINQVKKSIDMDGSDPNFSVAYNPSQVGTVIQEDLGYTKLNQDEELKIVYFTK
ncbi:MAG: cadherin-like beta sandwich domain-containing protein [Clostridia bacterium]|nr:cadherin-like beta sandwich domain-containing protein [Clostridia bacterium]